jgi:hypothetical protein
VISSKNGWQQTGIFAQFARRNASRSFIVALQPSMLALSPKIIQAMDPCP